MVFHVILAMKRLLQYIYLFATLTTLVAACAEDDTFTQSAAYRLAFSTDTVRLDTTFSNVPTATRTFWVFNRTGANVRCAGVRLEHGNQTGFRVNVDGTYLSPSAGYQVQNVEVRKGDSVRVFVELTSAYNHGNGPLPVEDNLIFTLESGVQQKVRLNAYSWDATLLRGLEVKHDTTIAPDRPVVFYGDIKVAEGATLTIAPGTTLYFHDRAGIDVIGRLLSKGEAGREVILRGDRIDRMFDYLPYDLTPGHWQGVRLRTSSYDNEITFTDIHGGYYGVLCDSADVSRTTLTLENSTLHNVQGSGLRVTHAAVIARNCQFTNTLGNCVGISGGRVDINQCTLAQFYPLDSKRGAAIRFANHRSLGLNLTVTNSLITGYADDVMVGDKTDSTDFNYAFDHCIIRTPKLETKDSVCFTHVVFEDPKDTVKTGEKHFVKIDAGKLRYDFRLRKISPAIGAADKATARPTDRLGRRRDDNPDIGCYEWSE